MVRPANFIETQLSSEARWVKSRLFELEMWFNTLSNLALQLACESPSSKAERKAQHAANKLNEFSTALLKTKHFKSRDLRQQLLFFF